MDQQLTNKVNLFFTDPAIDPVVPPGSAARLSVLYLLRRDIRGCLSERKYLFPATMTILAGIDLLAKFHAGSDDTGRGRMGRRYLAFISSYFAPLAPNDGNAIYRLRNALLHSFGLYSEGINFRLADFLPGSALVERPANDTCVISVYTLYHHFEGAIERYHAALTASEGLQQNFDSMFDRYGFLDMGVYSLPQPQAPDP